MKSFKRHVCLILALLFVLTAFAGCGKGSEEDEGKEIKLPEPEVTAAPATEAPTEPPRVEMDTPTLAEYVQDRTVTISIEMSDGSAVGSGFFVDDQGTIVTSYHVIDAADSISVEVSDGGKYDVAKIVDFNESYDIAVLKIDISGNPYLNYASEAPRTGESVYAVGSSLGFLNGTFSDGIISNTSRAVGMIDCVQTTAAISNGNSGGPLVNVYGEVVGINAFSYQGGENLNLAVKIDTLDLLNMDKNWNINQYREWYKKEIGRSYRVWNYTDKVWELSKINTYQHVTGQPCFASSYDWEFLGGNFDDVVEGYDDGYGVFCYNYVVSEFDAYTEYLNSIGFFFTRSEDFTEGTSYYYENEFSGFCMDIFIMEGDEYMIIEPYCN